MYRLIKGTELMKKIKPLEWIWEPFIPRSCVSLLASRGGVGKSGFALWLADKLAGEGRKVIYFDVEKVGFHVKDRTDNWNLQHLDKIIFVENTTDASPTTTSPDNVTGIYELVREESPDLIIIDSFTALAKKYDANRRETVAQIYSDLSTIYIGCNTAILLLAHEKKRQSGDSNDITLDSIAGSGAITDLARSVMTMNFDKSCQPNGRIIHQTKVNLTAKFNPLTFKITDKGITDVKFLDLPTPSSRASGTKADKFKALALEALEDNLSKKDARQLLKENLASPVEAARALDWASKELKVEWIG